jgi:glycosyltransferase involved in cell wall biosynthesis
MLEKDHTPLKILFATHVAYWQNQTGAQQRILALVKHLARTQRNVETLFSGKVDQADLQYIEQHQLQVVAGFQEPDSRGWLSNFLWQIQCIWNWLFVMLRLRSPDEVDGGRELKKFHSRRFGRAFRQKLISSQPDLVVIEYISLAYLHAYVPKHLRDRLVLAIDTHDVMHSRCYQFLQMGHDHWIYVNEEQERKALSPFDLVVAIQPEELKEFKRILPSANVIAVLHSVEEQLGLDHRQDATHALQERKKKPLPVGSQALSWEESSKRATVSQGVALQTSSAAGTDIVRIGYFGSSNASNLAAINGFLKNVWPSIVAASPVETELVVAGRVCEQLDIGNTPQVRAIGFVEHTHQFYEMVQLVVNPVQFGTGLKIKNLEAIAYGKCLVTSTAGSEGMQESNDAFLVADSNERFVEVLLQLIADPDLRQNISLAAARYTASYLSAEAVYAPFIAEVRRIIKSRAVQAR